jgi:hypothetical protein
VIAVDQKKPVHQRALAAYRMIIQASLTDCKWMPQPLFRSVIREFIRKGDRNRYRSLCSPCNTLFFSDPQKRREAGMVFFPTFFFFFLAFIVCWPYGACCGLFLISGIFMGVDNGLIDRWEAPAPDLNIFATLLCPRIGRMLYARGAVLTICIKRADFAVFFFFRMLCLLHGNLHNFLGALFRRPGFCRHDGIDRVGDTGHRRPFHTLRLSPITRACRFADQQPNKHGNHFICDCCRISDS